ncbi:MAG: YtxH domain-containing protein [Anaerolineales bacterium]|jgi:gas vesicle protein|nr:YtxH domain-containing protein [Anaerolineales bacterium]
MQRAFSLFAGALVGALVGATLMVLFTPAPGETIRSDLKNRIQTLKDEMQGAAASRRAEMEAQLARLRAPQG